MGRVAVVLLAMAGLVLVAATGSARVLAITVTTQLSTTSAATGDSVTDQATLVGAGSTVTGTVTYSVYTSGDCTGTAVFASTVDVTNGTAPPSAPFIASPAGTYQWQAIYKQYPKKTGIASPCGTEQLIVKNRPTVLTTLSTQATLVSQPVTDQATLPGVTSDAGGSLTYSVYPTNDCSGAPIFTSTVPVSNGAVPLSAPFSTGSVGVYQWQAVYGGDGKNQLAASACGSEPLVVGHTAITTQLSATSVTTGASVTDQGSLAGVASNGGGTVTYSVYATADCSGAPYFTSTVAVTNGTVPPSGSFTASPAGTYQWVAAYSGDANYDGAQSICGTETLTVKNQAVVATQLSTSSARKGDLVTDQATLPGATSDAGGSLTYSVYPTSDCSGAPVFTSTVTVSNGSVPLSGAFTADPVGSYQWLAAYTGDARNLGATTACGAEPLTVYADPMVPIMDMGTTTTYYGFQGGLYENGSNDVPADHTAIGLQRANQVTPLSADGTPSPNGKIVLISMGASSQSQEWCGSANMCTTPTNPSFMSFAAANTTVNHTTLAIINGAQSGNYVNRWTDPTLARSYGAVLTRLTAAGLTEAQVQVAWFKDANPTPPVSLPFANADVYSLKSRYGQILRAIKTRYPNIREVFFSSRLYGGYVGTVENRVPEPYSYEGGFAVKWLIQAQIDQMRTGVVDSQTGDINYNTVAPWAAWGPYMWANGTIPRSDGLVWLRSDFGGDGEHPSGSGKAKVANMLMTFFLNSQFTRCWFTNTGSPCA